MAETTTTLPEQTVEGAAPGPSLEDIHAYPTDDPGHVAFTSPEGEVQSIPAGNAQKALELGYRPSTDVEFYRAKTGAAGTAMAAAAGFGRGLSFGTYDALAVGAEQLLHGEAEAGEMRRTLRLLKEGHETASTVGEIGGSLAPLAFGLAGGGGAAAAGASEAAGSSALARAGARALSAAPAAFLEGVAIAEGQQLSEDILGNHELSAQKYVNSGLQGGALGMLLGAALHAGVGAVGDKLAARAERAAEGGGSAAGRSIGTRASEFAEEQAAKSMMPASTLSGAEMNRLGKTAEEQATRLRQIGRTALDEGIVTAGADKATMAQRLTKRVGEVGEELGSLRKSLEKAEVRPSVENVLRNIKNEVLDPLMSRAFTEPEMRAIEPYVAEIARKTEGKTTFDSFEQLTKLKEDLDAKLYPKARKGFAPPAPPAGFEHLEKIRMIMEGEFERAADAAANELGTDVGQKYRVTKALFQDLKTAEKWATKGAAREAQHRGVSLTDTIAGSHGISAAVGGLVAGHPVAALGLLAGPANKIARTYGKQASALIADKAARIMGIQRAAETFDARVAKAVDGFFAGGKKKAEKSGTKYLAAPRIDPEQRKALREMLSNPAVMSDRVAGAVERTGLSKDAPRVAQGITNTLMRAGLFLRSNMPPEPAPVGFQFGPVAPRALGALEQAKFDAVAGALDVEGLLSDMENGHGVDRQKVEALKFINPEAYDTIMQALIRKGQANGAELTHQQEVALSILSGRPIGAMMQPRTIRGFQEAHASQGPAPDPNAGGGQTKPIGSANEGGPSRVATSLLPKSASMEAGDEL